MTMIVALLAQESLEVEGGLKLGAFSASVPTNGTMQWNGFDFMGYKGGIWTSLTAGGGSGDSDWLTSGSGYYNLGKISIGTVPNFFARFHVDSDLDPVTSLITIDAPTISNGSVAQILTNTSIGTNETEGLRVTNASNTGGDAQSYGQKIINSSNTGTQTRYGLHVDVSSPSPSADIGVYSKVGGGNKYAFWGEEETGNGFAGLFRGRGKFTNDFLLENFISPGSSGRIKMTKDGSHSGATLDLFNQNGFQTFKIYAESASNGAYMAMHRNNGLRTIEILASESNNQGSQITMYDGAGHASIEIDADYNGKGRIIMDEMDLRGGADIAEYFEVVDDGIENGKIVSIDPNNSGKLKITDGVYDHKVIGVISGAGQINPGIIMGQEGSVAFGDHSVSILGRVYVKASDENGKIKPGDLLTSSSISGIAMKATDTSRMLGSIIGKAMTQINEKGLVLVFLNIQ